MQRYLRGQIWWCNSFYDVKDPNKPNKSMSGAELFGSIQQGIRPVLIVSNDVGNKESRTLQVIPCTTQEKVKLPTHYQLFIDRKKNTFLCEQLKTVNVKSLYNYMITLDDYEMSEISKCLEISLGMKHTKDMGYNYENLDKLLELENGGDYESNSINRYTDNDDKNN